MLSLIQISLLGLSRKLLMAVGADISFRTLCKSFLAYQNFTYQVAGVRRLQRYGICTWTNRVYPDVYHECRNSHGWYNIIKRIVPYTNQTMLILNNSLVRPGSW
jgi:hypothetical protein